MRSRFRLLALASAAALTSVSMACLGNSPPGGRDHLYVLLVDPQRRHEHLSTFDLPENNFCTALGCVVRVEIIDLTNHTRFSGFSVPATAQAADGSPTGYANSFAVSRYGDRVYIGERMAEEVQAFSAGGVLLGTVPAGVDYGGPLDMVLSSDDSTLFVLDARGISLIKTATMTNLGRWNADKTTSSYGLGRKIVLSPDEEFVIATSEQNFTFMFFVKTTDMTTAQQPSIGYLPPPTCEQTVDDMIFTPYERLLLLDGSCEMIYQYDLPTGLYFGGFEIELEGGNLRHDHMDYSRTTDQVYTSVFRGPDSTSEIVAASPTTSVESLGALRGMITDVARNVGGLAVYYSVSWSWNNQAHESRRLAVVHTPTGTVSDSVYFFATTPGNERPPRVMEMQIVRKPLAPGSAPAKP